MTHLNRHVIRKSLATAGLTVLLAAGVANAGPALALQGPVSERAGIAQSDDVAPQVTGCNGTMPNGWQFRASYSYCYECRAAGMFWEATGNYRAHCQTYGNGVRLWTLCFVCRNTAAPEDRRLAPTIEPARFTMDPAQ